MSGKGNGINSGTTNYGCDGDDAPLKKKAKIDAVIGGDESDNQSTATTTNVGDVGGVGGVGIAITDNKPIPELMHGNMNGLSATGTPLSDTPGPGPQPGLFMNNVPTATSAQSAINSVLVGENAYSVVQLEENSELVNVMPTVVEKKEVASVSDITLLVDAVNAHNSLNSNLNISIESVSVAKSIPFDVPPSIALAPNPMAIPIAPIAMAPAVDTPSPPAPYVAHRASLSALRCDRVGTSTWNLHDVQIFDIAAFIEVAHQVYTIDIRAITDQERSAKRLEIQSKGLVSLESEFRYRTALRTVYPRGEFKQLKAYMETCLAICSRSNEVDAAGVLFGSSIDPKIRSSGELLTPGGVGQGPGGTGGSEFVSVSNTSIPSHCTYHKPGPGPMNGISNGINTGSGVVSGTSGIDTTEANPNTLTLNDISESSICFAYERIVQVGFIIRTCKSLNITNEVWRLPYEDDISRFATQPSVPVSNTNTNVNDTSGDGNNCVGIVGFITNMFPQLKSALNINALHPDQYESVIVKYYAQMVDTRIGNGGSTAEGSTGASFANPSVLQTDESLYQSIGTFSLSANELLSRYV